MTGGQLQWYNGITLLATFFCSRLVWGTYQSVRVFQDVWEVLHLSNLPPRDIHSSAVNSIFVPRDGQLCMGKDSCIAAQSEVFKFTASHATIPMWLALTYLGSNLILHSLNFYWFGRMIETVRKRFEAKEHDEFKHERESEAKGTRHSARKQSIIEELADELDMNEISGPKTPMVEKGDAMAAASKSTAVEDDDTGVSKRRRG